MSVLENLLVAVLRDCCHTVAFWLSVTANSKPKVVPGHEKSSCQSFHQVDQCLSSQVITTEIMLDKLIIKVETIRIN